MVEFRRPVLHHQAGRQLARAATASCCTASTTAATRIELPFQTFPSLPPGADPGVRRRADLPASAIPSWTPAGPATSRRRRRAARARTCRWRCRPTAARSSPRIRIEYPSDPTASGALTHTLPLKGNDRFVRLRDGRHRYGALPRSPAVTPSTASAGPVPADGCGVRHVSVGPRRRSRPSTTDICLFEGFDPDKVYEADLPGQGTRVVMGLGYAVTRDVASFLRYETADDAGNPNPLARQHRRDRHPPRPTGSASRPPGCTCATGSTSASTRTRRTAACSTRYRIHIPGTHRLFANVEFADPNIYSRQDRTTGLHIAVVSAPHLRGDHGPGDRRAGRHPEAARDRPAGASTSTRATSSGR